MSIYILQRWKWERMISDVIKRKIFIEYPEYSGSFMRPLSRVLPTVLRHFYDDGTCLDLKFLVDLNLSRNLSFVIYVYFFFTSVSLTFRSFDPWDGPYWLTKLTKNRGLPRTPFLFSFLTPWRGRVKPGDLRVDVPLGVGSVYKLDYPPKGTFNLFLPQHRPCLGPW